MNDIAQIILAIGFSICLYEWVTRKYPECECSNASNQEDV